MSIAAIAFYAIADPDALHNGVIFVIIVCMTLPLGSVLGAAGGAAIQIARKGEVERAGDVCRTAGASVAFLVAVYTVLIAMADADDDILRRFLSYLLLPWVGSPFVWAMLLAIVGPVWMRRIAPRFADAAVADADTTEA